jgi:hypothetical protein
VLARLKERLDLITLMGATDTALSLVLTGLPSRRQLFLSGHLEEVMMKKMTLPDEVYLWMLHSGWWTLKGRCSHPLTGHQRA